MALHPDFPSDPHAILDPAIRWFPADEALRASSFEKLLPPLVPALRKVVKAWRDRGYEGAAETSRSLLNWWFEEPHLLPSASGTRSVPDTLFQYFFAQRRGPGNHRLPLSGSSGRGEVFAGFEFRDPRFVGGIIPFAW